MSIFRAYDIRGVYGKDLNEEIMKKIGAALALFMKRNNWTSVVVGRDIRASSKSLEEAFTEGLKTQELEIIDAGETAFGISLFTGLKLKKDVNAYITASHLTAEWNGIKFYSGEGIGFSEKKLKQIEKIFENVGDDKIYDIKVERINLKEEYIEYLKNLFSIKKMKVAVDCGNGSMCLSAPTLFKEIGFDVVELFCSVDSSFPNRVCDVEKRYLSEIMKKVVEEGANFGAAFDGDGDRVAIIDNKGRMLTPDQVAVIIGNEVLKEGKNIIANVECSSVIEDKLNEKGAVVHRIPVGHTFMTLEAKNKNAVFGVEYSGHYILPKIFKIDDGMILPLKFAEILSKTNKTLAEIVDEIPVYPKQRIDFNVSDEIKFRVVENIRERLKKKYEKVNTLDGARVDLRGGWALIRASNTSPMIRLTVEGKTEKDLKEISSTFSEILQNEINEAS